MRKSELAGTAENENEAGRLAGSVLDRGNRRDGPDRRRRPTPMLSRYTFGGRRKAVRRAEDKRSYIYVDQYNLGLFLFLLAILLLGVADAFLTLYHVHVNEAEEMNPFMEFFLGIGPRVFFHVKYVLTALCLIVLCLHKNLPMVRYLLAIVFVIYVLIVANHVYLFLMLGPP
ncbi:MAG: DUF5658 family protein [bacterium]